MKILLKLALFLLLLGPTARAGTLTTLYSFQGGFSANNPNDGSAPYAPLRWTGGNSLYGTTAAGGPYFNPDPNNPTPTGGTLFKLDRETGTESVLHPFGQTGDGIQPEYGQLVDIGGVFYGTARFGGRGNGSIYSYNPLTGKYRQLHTFTGPDGAQPWGGLTNVNGILYGTTWNGGANANPNGQGGTVFTFDPGTGVEQVLYSFVPQDTDSDPWGPTDTLLYFNGLLYGTATSGGSFQSCGSVFSINPSTGALNVIHNFDQNGYGTDACDPEAGLTELRGKLYGTSLLGGGVNFSAGAVYSVDLATGKEKVVHSFGGPGDGYLPFAGLLNYKGMLYGLTEEGGQFGGGTIFKIDPTSEAVTILYSFGGVNNEGVGPTGGLININGTFYGTCVAGGEYNGGTVFSFTE